MTQTPPEPDFAERPVWTRPGFIAAAGIVALIVLVGVLVAVLPGRGSGPAASPSRSPGTATSAAAPGGQAETPAAGAPATGVPTIAPNDVTWELVGQVAVPVSRSAGPHERSGGIASGYTHTPTGALIAAAQIGTRAGYYAGKASWEPTIERQFIPSADRDRLLANYGAVKDAPAQPGELSQIAGYLYQSYTPDTAVIGIVYRAPSAGAPRYHIATTTLLWRDGDWRMVAPPGGAWTSVNRTTTDLTGVVEWGAH